MSQNEKVIVAISGGIAVYKTCELVRLLRKQGHDVVVAMTPSAQRFVTPLTFAALSANPVLTDVWEMSEGGKIQHVLVAHAAKAIVVAPATASTLARLHAGLADNAVSALVLASQAPVLLAPAMETQMWENHLTQRNISALEATGRFTRVGPEAGPLASGLSGVGRMAEPADIAAALQRLLLPQDLKGKHIVISAGPTREPLDPVRFISNRSSGKMGFALAEAALQRGADVTLVHGPVALTPPRVKTIAINTALELQQALTSALPADILIMAAAVADFAPARTSAEKLGKAAFGESPVLALTRTPDVVASLPKGQTLFVGFAAETHDVDAHALKKLAAKGLDFIVANDVSQPGIGMDADDNHVRIFSEKGLVADSGRASKAQVAHMILDAITDRKR